MKASTKLRVALLAGACIALAAFAQSVHASRDADRCRSALVAAEQLQHATVEQIAAERDRTRTSGNPMTEEAARAYRDFLVTTDELTRAQNHYREARAQCPK